MALARKSRDKGLNGCEYGTDPRQLCFRDSSQDVKSTSVEDRRLRIDRV